MKKPRGVRFVDLGGISMEPGNVSILEIAYQNIAAKA